ncbi:aldo/keto reductase [Streptomyces sp. NPDC014773]|uniref:aldo/keto reductase n=1 Tax=Streptomyces sp. NPDC014773 TaxID=3364908 RepID=UPI0036FF3A27
MATEGGRGRPGDGGWTVSAAPARLKKAAEASVRRLGVDATGLYQLHEPDPAVPWAESVGALRELLDAGTIRAAGVSDVTTAQIRQAHQILGDGLVCVQNQYSPAVRDSEPELRPSERPGPAFLPWSPLGGISRSPLDGPSGPVSVGTAFHRVAAGRGVSPQQIALAWLLPRDAPGTGSRPASITDSAGAAELTLNAWELRELKALPPNGAGL